MEFPYWWVKHAYYFKDIIWYVQNEPVNITNDASQVPVRLVFMLYYSLLTSYCT